MTNHRINWTIALGITFGMVLGVVASKVMDGWPPHAIADGKDKEGRKVLTEQAASFRSAAKLVAPAVVAVTKLQHVQYQQGGGLGFDYFGRLIYKQPRIREDEVVGGVGSGFVFDAAKGYIMTNNHVVAEGDAFKVRLSDEREVEAKVVGADPQSDIAVLQVTAPNLTAAAFGNSDELEVGDWVLAVGNPFGFLEQTVTAGIISAKGRHGMGLNNYENFLQTDAAVNQGNSGGPLVNVSGEVVGVNTAILSRSGGYQGISLAIPINQAKKVAQQLVKTGSVVRGWMGVEVRDLKQSERKSLSVEGGATVEGVYIRGPAKKAGVLPGDVLLKIDGKPVHSSDDIRDTVAEMEPGAKVQLVVRRNDKTETLNVTVGTQPKNWGASKSRE
ncbi:MAG: trypsin-like peptidase domain-containing protein [Planctomycetota bacterium]|nr:trypsin-like peptidase domain-containing protein [Planctomycetota bacterium]